MVRPRFRFGFAKVDFDVKAITMVRDGEAKISVERVMDVFLVMLVTIYM